MTRSLKIVGSRLYIHVVSENEMGLDNNNSWLLDFRYDRLRGSCFSLLQNYLLFLFQHNDTWKIPRNITFLSVTSGVCIFYHVQSFLRFQSFRILYVAIVSSVLYELMKIILRVITHDIRAKLMRYNKFHSAEIRPQGQALNLLFLNGRKSWRKMKWCYRWVFRSMDQETLCTRMWRHKFNLA